MHRGRGVFLSRIFPSLAIFLVGVFVSAKQAHGQDSWLDQPLVNWNRYAGSLPKLPRPAQDHYVDRRCRRELRKPVGAAEKALVRRGWMLFGPVHSYHQTRVVMGLSGFDGMCRPTGFQAFVYWEGRYAGTLSPLLMNSRTDGALSDIHLKSVRSISVDFVRYKESDPLCCPSGLSTVVYTLRPDDIPELKATKVSHRETSPPNETGSSGSEEGGSLFGKRWTLSGMEGRQFSAEEPYIEFDRDQKRASGSGGCNRFNGAFETDGNMLKLSRIVSTRRACLDAERQRVETGFLQLLETTTRFEVQGNSLRLYAGDRLVLAFASK